MILLLVCLAVFALLLLAVSVLSGGRSKVVRRVSYKVNPVPVQRSSTSTQTRKEATKNTTLNSYAQTDPKRTNDDADDGIATAFAAAVILDSQPPLPAPSTEDSSGSGGKFGGGGASGNWDNDCSVNHSSDSHSSSSYDSGSSYSGGSYDSGGGGYDGGGGGGCDGGGGGGD